jgi:phage regulator Rha-like protein
MKYIELNGLKLYLPSSVSLEKGKKPYDYSANWSRAKNGAGLKGKEYRYAKGSEEHKLIRQLVWEKYGQQFRPAANADCKLIDEERALDYLNTPTPNCKITGVRYGKGQLTLVDPNEIRVSSLVVAEQLGIEHKSFIKTINKYTDRIERSFGKLIFDFSYSKGDSERPEKVYYLTRVQCDFLGTLSKNSEQVLDFKEWLVLTFNEYREKHVYSPVFQTFSNREENILQQMLVQLASYSDNPLKQEVVIDDEKHRVDLMYADNSVAIELKVNLITPSHIRTTIFERNYYHSLKKKFSNFQTLIISSKNGISQEAKDMISYHNPYIIYESVSELANRFIKNSKKEDLANKFQYLLQAA